MEINILNTYDLYNEMLGLPEEKRNNFFDGKFLKPFLPYFDIMQMPKTPETLGYMNLTGYDTEIKDMLNSLNSIDTWTNAKKTLEEAESRFRSVGVAVPEKIVLGVLLGDPELLSHCQGYTGLGSMPGFILVVIAPNSFNLPKLQACIAHEFHHNVLFYNAKWNFMDVTVGKYLAVEGLAESFAVSMFGEECIGPWVSGVKGDDLERTRQVIGKVLDVKGFMEVRKYMYGDHPMMPKEETVGIPYCGGYAAGYHAVQAYIKRTGISAAQAAIIDGDEIMKLSGYFD